jgi:antitoxin PrlF
LTDERNNDTISLHSKRRENRFEGDMKEFITTITSRGQVTIPAEIRKYLGITTNDKIGLVIDDDGVVRIRVHRYPTMASLRGAAGRLNKPLSWKEIQKIAQEDRFTSKYESK